MLESLFHQVKIINLSISPMYTWTSGIKSPIYVDNRKLISYPEVRSTIIDLFIKNIKSQYDLQSTLIAAVASAGIPWAAFIADRLNLPMVYVRSKRKDYGLKNKIEGDISYCKNAIIIEDLISTGKSSINTAYELKENGLAIQGLFSIFNYKSKQSIDLINQNNISHTSLSDLDKVLNYWKENCLISKQELGIIQEWRKKNL